MTVATIDEARAVLYGEPLDAFVKTRNDLAKEVRAAGDRELANEIKTLRKPSVIAAELNGVVRGDGAGIEAMIAAAGALRDGQQATVAGGATDVAALQQAYRGAIQALAPARCHESPRGARCARGRSGKCRAPPRAS